MRTVILTALLPAVTLALSGSALADPNSCATTSTCEFHCHAGEPVYIQLFGDLGEPVEGSAECGGIIFICSGYGLGSASDVGLVCEFTSIRSGPATCWHHAGDVTACGNTLILR